ncbi:hypothetical protein ACFLT4_00885 [Chloroflexota bacterium]
MPLTFYSIHEARQLMEDETHHAYDIEAVRKAVKQGTLTCLWVGNEPLFTREHVMDYLHSHGRYELKAEISTENRE